MPLYYALRHRMTGAIFVKEADFFEAQGGLTKSWGRGWRRVEANSPEEARQLIEREVAKDPDDWPKYGLNAPVLGRRAGDEPLKEKIEAAIERYNRLSPEEKRAHDDAQQKSWMRGEMAISKAEREEGRHTRVMREPKFKSRFGHHPDPVIDYEVEVGALEAELIDLKAGLDHAMTNEEFEERLSNALDFNVVTPEGIRAKNYLREKVETPWRLFTADYGEIEKRAMAQYLNTPPNKEVIKGVFSRSVAPKVPEGQTLLDRNFRHRILDVLEEGKKARDSGDISPYHGHSLEHCLHATGWVYRDLELALQRERVKNDNKPLDELLLTLKEWVGAMEDGTPSIVGSENLYRKAKAFLKDQ